MIRIPITTWHHAPAPGIKHIEPDDARALAVACRAVDRDIEQAGAVSAATVDLVRAALKPLK